MNSSFQRMYDVVRKTENHPLEDYLTEVIAPIMESQEILISFLKRFIHKKYRFIEHIKVFTQRTYAKINDHLTDSRPDLVITFTTDSHRHIIFIENKLGSGEGDRQLSRYADHLNEQAKRGYHVHLLYITQFYDPKQIDTMLDKKSGSGYHQLQWYQFFYWLSGFEHDLYCKQVLRYMEGLGLNKDRKFTPTDIFSIQNSRKIQSMLDDCLDGKVSDTLTTLFGKPKQWINRAYQLREDSRYILYNDQSDWKFIGCGLWLTDDEYPVVTVFMEVHPNCNRRIEVLQAVEKFCLDHEGWSLDGPEDLNSWFTVSFDQSLVHFLSANDHIETIQTFIVEKLNELYQLKENNPSLQWS
ncbi:PD-(D/E)XK nuclease family protein [Bacillus sp. MM2020_1]|nr:PD-(D/E)XK nuclease family protein [Bacillus sp. MM2020_1]